MKNNQTERLTSSLPVLNGRVLVVDLLKQKWEEKAVPGDIYGKYLYGRGISACLLSGTIDLDLYPGKSLVLAPGLLTGIIPFSHSCLSIVEDDVRVAAYSFSGHWGMELKMAGFDCLIITGDSTIPVVLNIRNDIVSFYDLPYSWDQEAADCMALIKNNQGDQWVEVLVTAGPDFPAYSLIARSSYSSLKNATQQFESKKLKAISVRGTRGFRISHPEMFKKV